MAGDGGINFGAERKAEPRGFGNGFQIGLCGGDKINVFAFILNMSFKKLGEWFDNNIFNISKNSIQLVFTLWTLWVGVWLTDKLNNYSNLENKNFSEKFLFWIFEFTPIATILLTALIIYLLHKDNKISTSNKNEIEKLKFLNENLTKERNNFEDDLRSISSRLEESEETTYYQVIAHKNFINYCISRFLRHIASDHLSLDHNSRLSLYLHRENEFILAGRFSKNIDYNKPNRNFFPDNQGFIGSSWQTGDIIYAKQNGRYENWQKNQNICAEVLEEIRMRSALYCAIPIYNNSDREGILLAESLQAEGFTKSKIEVVVSTHGAYLVDLLQEMKRISGILQSMQES